VVLLAEVRGLAIAAVGVVVDVPEAFAVKALKVANEAFKGGHLLVLLKVRGAGVHLHADLKRYSC